MNKALLIVHMHPFYLQRTYDSTGLINRIGQAIEICKKKQIPIFTGYIQVDGRTPEPLAPEIKRFLKDYPLAYSVFGNHANCFAGTDETLSKPLNTASVEEIALAGIYANGCVRKTAEGAITKPNNFKISTSPQIISDTTKLDLDHAVNEFYKKRGRVEEDFTKLF